MQGEINVKKGSDSIAKKIQREMFWWKLKSCPIIGQCIDFPKSSSGAENDSEELKLWYLTIELASAIMTKKEVEQEVLRKEILSNQVMKEPRAKEFSEYLSNLEYSKKESVNIILDYAQKIILC